MSVESVHLERRASQRFDVHLPLVIHFEGQTASGFSQNVSGRGVFLYTEANLAEGAVVELTFTMPSEITLAESMRVRCHGRVRRALLSQAGEKNGVAVQLESYQYLPSLDDEPAATLSRVAAEHSAGDSRDVVSR